MDFGDESGEGGVGGVEGLPARAGIEGFVEFVEGQEGDRRSVECFDVGRVEAEGGGAIDGCGAIVFWQGQNDGGGHRAKGEGSY